MMGKTDIASLLPSDSRLEKVFRTPILDGNDYADSIPAISDANRYGKSDDDILILRKRSADMYSDLDEPALEWDACSQSMFLYNPDPVERCIVFRWHAGQPLSRNSNVKRCSPRRNICN